MNSKNNLSFFASIVVGFVVVEEFGINFGNSGIVGQEFAVEKELVVIIKDSVGLVGLVKYY